jgi:hypothetical protein
MAVDNGWEARIMRYAWNTADLTKALYTRAAIRSEALKLLEKVAELRKEQDTVSLKRKMPRS